MAKKPTKKATTKKTTRRKKVAAASAGLTPAEVAATEPTAELTELEAAVAGDGGVVLGRYRDPLGGRATLLVGLPLDRIAPTPYQRDLSATHAKRLTDVIEKVGRYIDPIVVVREADGTYHTPNGHHRLAAMRSLGARSIVALLVDDPQVAFRILALNVEKAHNLKEKSLEVVRMYRALAVDSDRREGDFALEFEEPAFITLGVIYEERARFSGGAYNPVLKRVERFLDLPLGEALAVREARAARLVELDDRVAELVSELKERGHQNPYLKTVLVARINPLRFKRGATMEFDDCLDAMIEAASELDPASLRPEDLAASAPPAGSDD